MIERTDWLDQIQPERLDTLTVLGRGKGDTAFHRGEVAAEIASYMPENSAIIFCGGNSWNEDPFSAEPGESDIALEAAAHHLVEQQVGFRAMTASRYVTSRGVTLMRENKSRSTAENLCNAATMFKRHDIIPNRMGILSDTLHFRYHRPTNAAQLVFPKTEIVDITLEREHSKREVAEEWLITRGTNFFMRNVKPGDHDAIMRQQRAFENTNRRLRSVAALPMRLLGK
jgi:hypothetical protein